MQVLSDAQWAVLRPLLDAVRPRGKTAHRDLRRTIEAILWRHQNGAKWRGIPAELGPWWSAAQTFIRWAKKGVWERLLERVQRCGISFGMVFLDGTSIRAHQKAAGAVKKGAMQPSATAGCQATCKTGPSAFLVQGCVCSDVVQAASKMRWRSRSNLARPHIVRLIVFR